MLVQRIIIQSAVNSARYFARNIKNRVMANVFRLAARVDPSAVPPNRFRLAAVKSGWRAGSSRRAVENSAGGGAKFSGGGAAGAARVGGATQLTHK